MFLPILVILFVVVIYLWSLYNFFVTAKTRIGASVQEIGNQLKRQADLIPNLTASVKGYLKHEKEIFEKLTEARKMVVAASKSGDAQELVEASSKMQQALAPIRVVLESNPQLQAQATVSKLMDELRDTADKVMYSRRTLIDLTADYNIKRVTFPSMLVAKLFNFEAMPGLKTPEEGEFVEVGEEATKTPKVEL